MHDSGRIGPGALAALLLALLTVPIGCRRAEEAGTPSAALPAAEEPRIDPSLPPHEAGRQLYERLECAGCHESAAVPGLIIVPLHDLDARYSEDALAAFLSAPPKPMPNFELDERERHALAVYLRATFSGTPHSGSSDSRTSRSGSSDPGAPDSRISDSGITSPPSVRGVEPARAASGDPGHTPDA